MIMDLEEHLRFSTDSDDTSSSERYSEGSSASDFSEIIVKKDVRKSSLKRAKLRYFVSELDRDRQRGKISDYKEELKEWLQTVEESLLDGRVSDPIFGQEACREREKDLIDRLENDNRILTTRLEEISRRFLGEYQERKNLLEQVQELKGNIRVFCRVRSVLDSGGGIEENPLSYPGENSIAINNKKFTFDRVYKPHVVQDVKLLLHSAMDGYSVCIFAYGQTGAGKTFTMVIYPVILDTQQGTEDHVGVTGRTFDELFRESSEREKVNQRYSFTLGVIEIYNETIRDLLSDSEDKLEIRQGTIDGLREVTITSPEEALAMIALGLSGRSVGSTEMNDRSSRSHCIVRVTIRSSGPAGNTVSKLSLIDLAGSERLTKSQAKGNQLTEAKHINKSLAALGNVIAALGSKQSHVPYRDAKLTHLLQDSFGGHAKTLMIVCVNPNVAFASESLCSLNFAARAKSVELGAAKKHHQHSHSEVWTAELSKERDKVVIGNVTHHQVKRLQEELRLKDDQITLLKVRLAETESKAHKVESAHKLLEDKSRLNSKMSKEELKRKEAELELAQKRNRVLQSKLEAKENAISNSRMSRTPKTPSKAVSTRTKRVLEEVAPKTPKLVKTRSEKIKSETKSKTNSPPPSYESHLLKKRKTVLFH